jgi:hypothetical protein
MLVDIKTTADKGRVFRLMEPLRIEWRDKPALNIPWGFRSDGASVPRFFWRLVFPKGDEKALRAAFVHDWIYQTHPAGWTKEEADLLFYELLREDGVPTWRAWLAYKGVDLFGGLAWKTWGEC